MNISLSVLFDASPVSIAVKLLNIFQFLLTLLYALPSPLLKLASVSCVFL